MYGGSGEEANVFPSLGFGKHLPSLEVLFGEDDFLPKANKG